MNIILEKCFPLTVKITTKLNNETYVKLNELQKFSNQVLRHRLNKYFALFHDR